MSNEIKTNTEVVTWADGHGRWHVSAPEWMTPAKAVKIIAWEIWERDSRGRRVSECENYVGEHIVSIPSEEPGRVHFAEYSI